MERGFQERREVNGSMHTCSAVCSPEATSHTTRNGDPAEHDAARN